MSGRLQIHPGFVLLLALLLFWDQQMLIPRFLLAAAVHELGHAAAAFCTGASVRSLSLDPFGAKLVMEGAERWSYGQEFLVAVSGPLANVGLSLLCAALGRMGGGEEAFLFSGIHLCLGLFQLLPVLPLDGGRALYALVARFGSLSAALRVTYWSGMISAGLVVFAGILVLVYGGLNGTLLLLGFWLLWGNFREMGLVKAGSRG